MTIANGIPYLKGGEQPTAALMNALPMTLDRKLTLLLSGKSPIIAQAGTFPAFLLGKCFFFTSGGAIYAPKVPGYQSSTTVALGPAGTLPVARPYNPWQGTVAAGGPYTDEFTTAINAMVALNGTTPGTITFDEVNKIANLTVRFPHAPGDGAHYPAIAPSPMGLPYQANNIGSPSVNAGFLENSLTAHYLLHQGASDAAPVPYYIKEGPCAVERRSDWGLAEIIIEGPVSITLPDAWDKYNFFRVHNLNRTACAVSFGGHFTLKLAPFACGTVRRTAPAGSYAANGNYFFYAQTRDPRFFWFTQTGMGNLNGVVNTAWPWDGRVTDTMAANNLTNPAGLLDWVAYFTRTVDDYPNYDSPYGGAQTIHAGFLTDPTRQSDEYSHYRTLFGDPSNPATLLGDLLHHQGTVYAIQVSKTKFDALSGTGYTQLLPGRFNGYATLVADMAALGVSVTARTAAGVATTLTDPAGILQLSNANPSAYDVYLIPTGTNFLKRGDVQASVVSLSGSTRYPIESAVFEVNASAMDPGGLSVMNATPNLGVTPGQLSFPPVVTTAANTKSYYPWASLTGNPYVAPVATVLTGPNLSTMTQPAWAKAPVIGGIHTVTVASLTSLSWWGGANTAHYSIAAMLKLTPQGLALVWSEQFDGTTPSMFTPAFLPWTLGQLSLVQNHCIYFRGHGWGYTGSQMGSKAAGFLSCRQRRYQVGNNFTNEANNVLAPGGDFTYGPLDCSPVQVTTLTRNMGGFNWGGSRFWQTKRGGDDLLQLLANLSLPQFNVSAFSAAGDNDVFTLQTFTGAAAGTLTVPNTWTDNRLGTWWGNGHILPLTEGAMPSLCMALLPEMYNHIAATINRASQGVPLDYRALLFNYGGCVFPFNPQYVCNGSYIGGSNFSYGFGGPVPINQFCSFDSGSVFESFCTAMGIQVSTAADFPDQTIIAAQHRTTPPILVQQATCTCSNASYSLDATAPGFGTLSLGIDTTVTLSAELLKNGRLLQGQPTGSLCKGTYDPNDLSLWAAGGPPFTSADGSAAYWVAAADMNADTAAALYWNTGLSGAWPQTGDLIIKVGVGANTDQLRGTGYLHLGGNPGDAVDPLGRITNLLNAFTLTDPDTNTVTNYCWITLAEVERFMLTLGFTFNFEEVSMPLTLTYLEDPFLLGSTTVTSTMHRTATHDNVTATSDTAGDILALMNSMTQSSQSVTPVTNGGGRSLKPAAATWLGWYVDTSPNPEITAALNARWKLLSDGHTYYAPLPVTDLKSRLSHSNLCMCLQAYFGLGFSSVYFGSTQDPPHPGDPGDWRYYGWVFQGTRDMGTQINAGAAAPLITPGVPPSASGLCFLPVEFVLPNLVATDTPFRCLARAPIATPMITNQEFPIQSYQEYNNADNYDAYVLHTFGLPRVISVSLVGRPAWICAVDSWGSPDGIFYLDGDNNLCNPGWSAFAGIGIGIPWTAMAAPANVALGAGATVPTSNGGSEVFTILQTPAPQQRYIALFDLARQPIDLSTSTTPTLPQLLASSSLLASASVPA